MNIEETVDRLLEQGPYKYEKPFPTKATAYAGGVPGKLVSMGTPWRIEMTAEDAPIPWEMFSVMDLHTGSLAQPRPQGFIGWIGGTWTKGREEEGKRTHGAVFVDEAQSDLLQRTIEFVDPEKYKQRVRTELGKYGAEYGKLSDELEQLKKEFAGSQAYMPLKQQLAAQERMDELEAALEQIVSQTLPGGAKGRLHRTPKHPEFAQYKSKVENFYKRWTETFFNAALDFAKDKEATFLCILPYARVRAEWQGNLGGREASLFQRIYDGTAQKWHMELRELSGGLGQYWFGYVDALVPLAKGVRIERRLGEQVAGGMWQAHLDAFVRHLVQRAELSLNRANFEKIFLMWLDIIPDEMIADEGFRGEVEAYIQEKFGQDVSAWWTTSEEVSLENIGQWLIHLDAFVETFARQQGLNAYNQEGMKEVFEFWLGEIPGYVKYVPKSQERINQYVMEKYGVDASDWWPESPDAGMDWSSWELPGAPVTEAIRELLR